MKEGVGMGVGVKRYHLFQPPFPEAVAALVGGRSRKGGREGGKLVRPQRLLLETPLL